MGDRLQLQRRGVIAKPGCVYLDARRAKGDAIRDSGMSTSEQLSEDTHPHRRPSTGVYPPAPFSSCAWWAPGLMHSS